MNRARRIALAGLCLALAVPAFGLSEPAGEGTVPAAEQNRRLLEKWRADPEHYARLKRDLADFRALPPEQQARLRQLDRELHADDPSGQGQLLRVLERYVAWLDRLPEPDRERIRSAAGTTERLRIIRELREREWIDRLPRKVRDEVWALHPRDEASLRRAKPTRLGEFPPEVQAFVKGSLLPLLSKEEDQRLQAAEGQWPLYGRTLLELAEAHHERFPRPKKGPLPVNFQTLPQPVRERLMGKDKGMAKVFTSRQWQPVRAKQGKWPDFAIAFTETYRKMGRGDLPQQLGPSRPEEFTPPWQNFIDKTLMPLLTQDEYDRLKKARGKWPQYPQLVLELAERHKLSPPSLVLPGPPEFWNGLSSALPDVPDHTLRGFALTELTPDDWQTLQLSQGDPSSRERLTKAYYDRHPEKRHRSPEEGARGRHKG